MITLKKTGREVKIVKGSKKAITGKQAFIVRFTSEPTPINILLRHIWNPTGLSKYWNKPFGVQKHELNYENDSELFSAIKYHQEEEK